MKRRIKCKNHFVDGKNKLQDCKKPVSGKSFYSMEGKPVCPKCVGADEEEEEEA